MTICDVGPNVTSGSRMVAGRLSKELLCYCVLVTDRRIGAGIERTDAACSLGNLAADRFRHQESIFVPPHLERTLGLRNAGATTCAQDTQRISGERIADYDVSR